MHTNRRTSIIVVGGALAVASAAYGLGTQAGDGTAVADTKGNGNGVRTLKCADGTSPGFDRLATALGVEASELDDAFRDFKEQEHGERQDELAAELAAALEIPVDKVRAALEKTERARFEIRREPSGKPDGERGVVMLVHKREGLSRLASALGVTRAELRAAFEEVKPGRTEMESHWEQEQQNLARFLADRFNLDVDKVTSALDDLPRPTTPPDGEHAARASDPGPGGRRGPGGPDAFGPPL